MSLPSVAGRTEEWIWELVAGIEADATALGISRKRQGGAEADKSKASATRVAADLRIAPASLLRGLQVVA